MKKILITGANSFIGTSFEQFLNENHPDEFIIDTLDMKDSAWKEKDFSSYDSVFHVAGIAHSDNGSISENKEKIYYTINTDLAIETAQKAKEEGVSQFVFMSSAIVYGDSTKIGEDKIITKNTPLNPTNSYGNSKALAEKGLIPLNDENFKVVILRPPMIYGKGCRGNYQLLVKISKITPVFPYIKNQRSMLYVENLCEFVRLVIDNGEQGVFWPQNSELSNTSEFVKLIALANNKKLVLLKGFTWLVKFMGLFFKSAQKAFGNLVYDSSLSTYKDNYCLYTLEESINKIEGE